MALVLRLVIAFALCLSLNNPIYTHASESSGESGSAESGDNGQDDELDTATLIFTDRDTNKITKSISSGNATCLALPKQYRADCLAQNLKESSRLVRKSGYREANRIMSSGSAKINRLVRQNEDKSAPKIRRGKRTYRAVKKSAVAKVNRQAAKIVTETKTKLLRSSRRSRAKKTHYARIAKAVDSTKVLLRS